MSPSEADARTEYDPPVPRLAVGAVLGRTFSTWFRNAPAFAVQSAIVHLPWAYWVSSRTRDPATFTDGYGWRLVAKFASGLLAAGPIAYGVVRAMQGRRAPWGETLRVTARSLLPSLRLALLVGAWMALLVFLVGMVLVMLTMLFGVGSHDAAGTLVGLVALTPVAWVLVRCAVAVPAMVVERAGAFEAIERSAKLTARNRLRVGVVLLGLFLLETGVFAAVYTVFRATGGSTAAWRILVHGELALSVLVFAPLSAVAAGVVYFELRTEREGMQVEELDGVFE